MAERPFPAGRRLRGLPPARERHRHGPGLRGCLRGRPAPALGVRAGFFASVDGAPAAGYRAPRAGRPADDESAHTAPGRHPDRRVRGPGAGTAGRLPGPDRRPGGAGGQPLLRGQHRGVRPADRRPTWPACSRTSPTGHRYLLPDACLSEGRFLDDLTLADLPRPVEVVPTDGLSLRPPSTGAASRFAGPGGAPTAAPARRCPSHSGPAGDRGDRRRAGQPAGGAEPDGKRAAGWWWPWSAVPTWGSRRWSTASWAVGWPSSRSARASPGTARSSRRSGAAGPSPWSTPAAG